MLEGLQHLISLERPASEILRDLVDILIVAFFMYRALLVLKGTRAMQAGMGFVAFGVLYLLAKYAQLVTLVSVLSWLASSAILIVVVVFQNDIKRALTRVGSKAGFSRSRDAAEERVIEAIVTASTELARRRTGALIVLERDANVLEFVTKEGLEIDSRVERDLLVTLFLPPEENKLHDGAVLIRNLRIARAGVFLPLAKETKLTDRSYGTRHHAAIGITEKTDAVVVAVSEERGSITLCFPNGMAPNLDASSLREALLGLFGRAAKEPVGRLARLRAAHKARRARGKKASGRAEPNAHKDAPEQREPASDGERPERSLSVHRASRPPSAMRASSASVSAKKSTSQSGHFTAIKRQEPVLEAEPLTPGPPRVSIPMPSPKDRATPASSEAKTASHEQRVSASEPPATSSVSKPMAPTELPATTVSPDDN